MYWNYAKQVGTYIKIGRSKQGLEISSSLLNHLGYISVKQNQWSDSSADPQSLYCFMLVQALP